MNNEYHLISLISANLHILFTLKCIGYQGYLIISLKIKNLHTLPYNYEVFISNKRLNDTQLCHSMHGMSKTKIMTIDNQDVKKTIYSYRLTYIYDYLNMNI